MHVRVVAAVLRRDDVGAREAADGGQVQAWQPAEQTGTEWSTHCLRGHVYLYV